MSDRASSTFAIRWRHALRSLFRAPGFSLAVVATLFLALGPGLALLALIDQIYWKALPVTEPERLVVFQPPEGPYQGHTSQWSDFSVPLAYREYRHFADWPESPFTGIAARSPVRLALADRGRTEQLAGELVSGNFFEVLGLEAAAGRLLTASDDLTIGAHPVVVLSWAAWQRRFAGDPAAIGRSIFINGHPMTVIGVAPRAFQGVELGFAPELWLPIAMKPIATPLVQNLANPTSRWLNAVARLAPEVTREQAEARANVRYRQWSAEIAPSLGVDADFRRRFVARHLTLLPGERGRSDLRGDFGRGLVAVLILVGLLLALACANLANLFAVRATRRERELTVRLAVGARRRDLLAHLVTEAGLLAGIALVLALGFALAAPRLLAELLPPALAGIEPSVSIPWFTSSLLLGLAAALGVGLLPALLASRGEIAERLRGSAEGALGGRAGVRLRAGLIGLQVALSSALLVGAGLLVRSLERLSDRSPGYETESVLTFRIDPRLAGRSLAEEGLLGERLEHELARLPGVTRVARAETPLLTDWIEANSLEVRGLEFEQNPTARFDIVSPSYFAAMEIALRQGRPFGDADTAKSAAVAIVNRALVAEILGGGEALGRRLRRGGPAGQEVEIVGVVDDVLSGNLRETPQPFVYLPFSQAHRGEATSFYLRTAVAPASLAEPVRRTAAAIDPQLPVVDLQPLAAQARHSLALEHAMASIASALGALAALLAALGLYAILSYGVAARRRELALRAALGAGRRQLGRLLVDLAGVPVARGLAAGLSAALAGGRLLGSLLFGVAAHDPATFAAVALGCTALAALAALRPALTAMRTQPAAALREE